jgi:hypothetical protein
VNPTLTVLKAQRAAGVRTTDSTSVTANLFFKDVPGHEERYTIPISALKDALARNRGIGILDLQLPGEIRPRHVIINRFVQSSDGRRLKHLVLKEVSDSDRVRSLVPVIGTGIMPMRRKEVVIRQICKAVDLRGPTLALSKPIRYRIADAEPGTVVYARDLILPEGAALCSDPDQVIFRVEGSSQA